MQARYVLAILVLLQVICKTHYLCNGKFWCTWAVVRFLSLGYSGLLRSFNRMLSYKIRFSWKSFASEIQYRCIVCAFLRNEKVSTIRCHHPSLSEYEYFGHTLKGTQFLPCFFSCQRKTSMAASKTMHFFFMKTWSERASHLCPETAKRKRKFVFWNM